MMQLVKQGDRENKSQRLKFRMLFLYAGVICTFIFCRNVPWAEEVLVVDYEGIEKLYKHRMSASR
jgi:hypothetical protein